MHHRIVRRLMLGTALAALGASQAWAQQPPARQLSDDGVRADTVFELSSAEAGDGLLLPLPGGAQAFLVVDQKTRGALNTLIEAHAPNDLEGMSELAVNGSMAWGTIRANGRTYLVDTGADGVATVTDMGEAGLREAPIGNDEAAAPALVASAPQGDAPQVIVPPGNTIVDIGLLYTPSMQTRYGLGLGARFHTLVDRLNLGLANSNIPLTYMIGHIGPVTYSETGDNGDMLDALRLGSGTLNVASVVRVAKGLDIMSAHRVFDNATHESCGVGYVTGGGTGSISSANLNSGNNVVSDGADIGGSNFLCSLNTFPHEVGHNMGQTHNREDTTSAGVHPWSYGYRVDGVFREIMAYASSGGETQLNRFSDPDVFTCAGNNQCGKPIGDPAQSATAQSIRAEGVDVSTFRNRLAGELYGATLPASRAIQVGQTATAYATIINSSPTAAFQCGLSIVGAPAGTFSYQTTNPSNNQPTGSPNTPVDIAAGAAQTFFFSVTGTATFAAAEVPIQYFCSNKRSANSLTGVNTFLLGVSNTPRPDMVALAATPSSDGIARLPSTSGELAFAAATANVGATGMVTMQPDTGGVALPLTATICQTDAGGICLAPATASVTLNTAAASTASFTVFLRASGPIPLDPAVNRVFVRARNNGVIVGTTSVAVQTP